MKTKKRWPIILCVSLVFVLLAWAGSVYAHEDFQISGDQWMNDYTLIITDAQSITEAYTAADAIEKAGGYVYVIFPNQVMLGKVPAEAVKGLVGKHKISGIHHKPVSASHFDKITKTQTYNKKGANMGEASANAINFFNKVVSGAWKTKKDQARYPEALAPRMLPDNFDAPPRNHSDVLANLKANGITEEVLAAAGVRQKWTDTGNAVLSPGASDYMVGKALFNAMFVESNGAVDANLYTWTAADRTLIQNEIVAGLSWWSNTARTETFKTPLTFIYANYYGTGTQTSYEPILHSSGEDSLWINQIMAYYGYSTGDKWARTEAFNVAKRTEWGTNWSVVSFIGYNPSPASSTFTDGYFAYTWGTYTQLLYRNDGWGTGNYDIVNAHETGHIFGATDEYYQAGYGGCTSCGAATNGVLNGNCEYCNANAQACMMRANTLTLCGYTPSHIGWAGLRNVSVYAQKQNGMWMDFFAASQPIQYKVYYCIAGPRLGDTTHTVNVRFRADYSGGTIDSPSTVYDDTGWATAGNIAPPATSGLNCYYTYWNRSVPADIAFGPMTVSAQLTVGQLGKAARSATAYIYASPGAAASSPLPDGWVGLSDQDGPYIVEAPAP